MAKTMSNMPSDEKQRSGSYRKTNWCFIANENDQVYKVFVGEKKNSSGLLTKGNGNDFKKDDTDASESIQFFRRI